MKTRKLHYYRASLAERRRKESIYRRNHPISSLNRDPLYPISQYIGAKIESLCILPKIATREPHLPCNITLAYRPNVSLLSLGGIDIKRHLDLIAEDMATAVDEYAGQAIADAVPERNR